VTKVLVLDQDLDAIKKLTQLVSQSKEIEKIFSATDFFSAEEILEKDQPELVFLTPSFYKLFSKPNLVINKDFVLLVDQKKSSQINAEAVKRCSAIMAQNASFLEFTILINSLKIRKIRGDQSKMRTVRGKIPNLTKKELEIVQLLCQGRSDAWISKNLHIANPTVKTHLRRIFSKMKVANRTHCVAQVIRARILS
jgi:two-component system NarL family response regulator